MLIIGASGFSKCADLTHFDYELRTWTLLPIATRKLIVLLVPPLEVLLALAWFLRIAPRLAAAAGAALLGSSTILYGLHLLNASQPRCACGGLLAAFAHMQQEGPVVLLRNAVLLGMLLGGTLPLTRRAPRHARGHLHDGAAA